METSFARKNHPVTSKLSGAIVEQSARHKHQSQAQSRESREVQVDAERVFPHQPGILS